VGHWFAAQDVAAFAAHLPDDALRHPHSEHWVAGARLTEGGPLAPYAGAHAGGLLVVLAGNAERAEQYRLTLHR